MNSPKWADLCSSWAPNPQRHLRHEPTLGAPSGPLPWTGNRQKKAWPAWAPGSPAWNVPQRGASAIFGFTGSGQWNIGSCHGSS